MYIKIKLYIKIFLEKLNILGLIYNSNLWKNKNKISQHSFQNKAPKIFDFLINEIQKNNLTIWPTFGTLLGLIRNNKLLDNDNDLDFGSLYNERIQNKISKIFYSIGLKKIITCYVDNVIVLEKFIYNDIEIDIYYFFEESGKYVSYDFEQDGLLTVQENINLGKKIIPYKNIYSKFDLNFTTINGKSFFIPEPIKNHLIDLYGYNYEKPDYNWHNNKRKNRYKMNDKHTTFDFHN